MTFDEALSHWRLDEPALIADTATSRVHKVRLPSGAFAALKILKPYGEDEISGAHLMVWYAGDGAARILGIHDNAILMEWLGGAPLGNRVRAGDDAGATEILCEVIQRLHRPRTSLPTGLAPLSERFATLFDTGPAIWPSSHHPFVAKAIELAVEMLETAPRSIPLHGDFHHDNVVGSARGWLAIDPKGILGDPAYDLANTFRNPPRTGDLASNPDRIEALANAFSARLGYPRKRLLAWAAAHSALSGCWSHQAGNALDWDCAMLPRLVEAVARA